MKTRIIRNFVTIVLLFISGIVSAEDFATVYFHDGTHKKLFLKELECITVSKIDLDYVQHGDYQTQLIETTNGSYLQEISQIDSIVFSQEIIHYPVSDEEIEASIDLSHYIATRTNDIVDSMKANGLDNPLLYVQEFMKMPNVIDVEINDNNSCITILRSDSIFHDFILTNDNYNMYNDSFSSHSRERVNSTVKFIPRKTESQAFYNHDVNEKIIVKEAKNILILAPFEDLNEDYLLDEFCESIKNCLHIEPHIFIGELADISKFKGKFLDGYDLVVFMTHGGESSTGTRLLSGSTMTKQKSYWKEAVKKGDLPELRLGTPEGHKDEYLEMTTKFLDNAQFNNSFILAFACSSADRSNSSPSLMKTFLDKGAAYYCGFSKPSKTGVVAQYGQKGALLSFMGVSLQDSYNYLKDQELVKFINKQWIQYGIEFFNFTQTDIDHFSLSLFDYEAKAKQCYMKRPYPFSLKSTINKEVVNLSWDSNLSEEKLVFLYPDMVKKSMEKPTWEFKIRYDVYLNDQMIASNLYDKQMWWEIEKNGTNKWYVIAKVINKTTNEVIATYKSDEASFTYSPIELQVAAQSLTLEEGERVSFTITSGNGIYTAKSNKENVATASVNGNEVIVNAISEGDAIITITDTKTNQTAEVAVKVIKKSSQDLALSTQEVYLNVGETKQIEVTAGSGHYSVWIYAPEVANVTVNGNIITIKGLSSGKTIVKVTDTTTNKTIPFGIEVKGPSVNDKDAVDLGLSVKWAKMNVGAVSEEDCGEHYAWGETESKSYFSWSSYDFCNGTESTISKYNNVDGKTMLDPSNDAAHVIMGGNWRTPTLTEMEELVNRCKWTVETLNGVKGARVTGPNGNSIFLPFGGQMFEDQLSHYDNSGYYYASTLSSNGEKYAPALCCFGSGNKQEFVHYARYYGLSIRGVLSK